MNDTQVILRKLAALRQRLDQAQGLMRDASATAALLEQQTHDPLENLEAKVAQGARHNALIEGSIRELPGTAPAAEPAPVPRRLSARGARLLQRARDLLGQLRHLAEEPLLQNDSDALAKLYRETAAMLDTVLRTVQAFPEAPSAQARLCDGLEAVLEVVSQRLSLLHASLQDRQRQANQVHRLAELLEALVRGDAPPLEAFRTLADELLAEARQGLPLRFLTAPAHKPARFAACHCLMTAKVLARLILDDPEWRDRPHEPVMAGLVHDLGMLQIPPDILAQPGPFTDEQRRLVEQHTRVGAVLLSGLGQGAPWLMEVAAGHHERSDGTGYPAGLLEMQTPPLVRLVTVCDVFAALCAPRPYRAALEPRTALTDTLLLAEQGALDRFMAERLLQLSFYPVGSTVELSDGAVAIVVAPHPEKEAGRPIVTLWSDAQGLPLPAPRLVNLAIDSRTIVRLLPFSERRDLIGQQYPNLV